MAGLPQLIEHPRYLKFQPPKVARSLEPTPKLISVQNPMTSAKASGTKSEATWAVFFLPKQVSQKGEKRIGSRLGSGNGAWKHQAMKPQLAWASGRSPLRLPNAKRVVRTRPTCWLATQTFAALALWSWQPPTNRLDNSLKVEHGLGHETGASWSHLPQKVSVCLRVYVQNDTVVDALYTVLRCFPHSIVRMGNLFNIPTMLLRAHP